MIEVKLSAEEIVSFFADIELTPIEKDYLESHAVRYSHIIQTIDPLIQKILETKNTVSILDIGPHYLTGIMKRVYGESVRINTLGWPIDTKIVPLEMINNHFNFDLNCCQHKEKWICPDKHDLVVMAEVIEHLYTAPSIVLDFVSTFLRPNGFLYLGTPNAVSLKKRLIMLLGQNPYERIRENYINPGHFREYTFQEMKEYCREVNLSIYDYEIVNYTPAMGLKGEIVRFLGKKYNNFNEMLSIIAQKN